MFVAKKIISGYREVVYIIAILARSKRTRGVWFAVLCQFWSNLITILEKLVLLIRSNVTSNLKKKVLLSKEKGKRAKQLKVIFRSYISHGTLPN